MKKHKRYATQLTVLSDNFLSQIARPEQFNLRRTMIFE